MRYSDDDESQAAEQETGYSAAILRQGFCLGAAEIQTGIQLLFQMYACFGNNGEWRGNYVCESRCGADSVWINGRL